MWDFLFDKIKRASVILLFFVSIFGSCRKEFIIDYPPIPPTLVVNCLFTNDSIFNIQIGKLQNLNDTADAIVKNAEVIIYEDGIYFETLSYNVMERLYKSEKTPQMGKTYTITVIDEGFPTVTATDKVPNKISIDSANVYVAAYYDSWEGRKLEVVNLFFRNDQAENYYEVISYSKNITNNGQRDILEFPNGITSLDPVILEEGILDQEKYQPTLVFSDKLLPPNAKVTFMPFLQLSSSFGIDETYTVLRNVSENYYLFRKQWYKYLQTSTPMQMNGIGQWSNMSFVTDPSEAFTNINNGLGIFAAYTETQKLMQIKSAK